MQRISNRHTPEKIIHVPVEVEKIVEIQAPPVDLSPIHKQIEEIKKVINHNVMHHNKLHDQAHTQLDMAGRALLALKMQRDVDRKRRLQLIIRLKKQRDAQNKLNLQLKLAVAACLLLTIISLCH